MKNNLFFTISFILFTLFLTAQSPFAFKYQAVARDAAGDVLADQNISIQFEILQGSETGTLVYRETHDVMTNTFGLVNLQIGEGMNDVGDFLLINWGSGTYYLQVGIDLNGGNDYQLLGTSQFLSVPYALHASSVDNVNDADADPRNEIQNIEVDTIDTRPDTIRNQIYLDSLELILTESGDTVTLYDSHPLNELQHLIITDTVASLASRFGYAYLELDPGISPPAVVDADPLNEIQFFSKSVKDTHLGKQTTIELIAQNFAVVDDVVIDDTDYTNELQRFRPVNIGLNFYILVEEKQMDEDGNLQFVVTDTICIPDSDVKNEIQTLDNIIHDLACSNEFELLLGHYEFDENGDSTWVTDGNAFIPDPDPVNELQRMQIENFSPLLSFSQLTLLRKECIPDSTVSGLQRTVWVPFDSIFIDDTNPTNELQELSYNPATGQLTITEGNTVDIDMGNESPWTSPTNDCIEYDGKATAEKYETKEGAVIIDDTGISRFDPVSGDNVSNICLEKNGNTTWGKVEILNNNDLVANLQSCIHRSGILDITGPNGNYNVAIGHEFGLPNNGMVQVYDSADTPRAGFYVDNLGRGISFADVKNFKIDHPADANKEIWYASLEGPEAGAYERGTSKLKDGSVFVNFSEHFKEVINPESMTVMLTPLSAETYGLAVIEKNSEGFRVKELMSGTGNFEFDWEVKSVRRSYENFEVVRDKTRHHSTHQHTYEN